MMKGNLIKYKVTMHNKPDVYFDKECDAKAYREAWVSHIRRAVGEDSWEYKDFIRETQIKKVIGLEVE